MIETLMLQFRTGDARRLDEILRNVYEHDPLRARTLRRIRKELQCGLVSRASQPQQPPQPQTTITE